MTAATVYTFDHLEAAACMWEHVQGQLLLPSKGWVNPWEAYRVKFGAAALRINVIAQAPALDADYRAAVAADGYDEPFDWEYVPAWLERNVAKVLA